MKNMLGRILILIVGLMIFVAGCSKEDVMIDDSKLKENNEEQTEEVVEEDDEAVEEEENEIDEVIESDNALTESEYINAMTEVVSIYSDTIFDINKHVARALDDIELLKDEEWIAEYELGFKPISMLIEVMDATEEQGKIPEGYHDMHTAINEALMHMEEAGEIMIDALNNDDIESYKKGIEMISESVDKIDEISDEINKKK